MNEQTTRFEIEPYLPKSPDLSSTDPENEVERTWCDSISETGQTFSETGLVRTSLKQSDHYFGCERCRQSWPTLESVLLRFLNDTFRKSSAVMSVLQTCIKRAFGGWDKAGDGGGDALAWRAIICAAGSFELISIWSIYSALCDLEAGQSFGAVVQKSLDSLREEEVDVG